MKVGVTIHKDGEWYVAIDPVTGVASQGKSVDEALKIFRKPLNFGSRMQKNGRKKEREKTENRRSHEKAR